MFFTSTCFPNSSTQQNKNEFKLDSLESYPFPQLSKTNSSFNGISSTSSFDKPTTTKAYLFQRKLAQQRGDDDKVFSPEEEAGYSSIEIFSDSTLNDKHHSSPQTQTTQTSSKDGKTQDQTRQYDSLTVDYRPKATIITRSLPQFEPEKKSRFALESINFKKSQSTNPEQTTVKPLQNQKVVKPKKDVRPSASRSPDRHGKSSHYAKR